MIYVKPWNCSVFLNMNCISKNAEKYLSLYIDISSSLGIISRAELGTSIMHWSGFEPRARSLWHDLDKSVVTDHYTMALPVSCVNIYEHYLEIQFTHPVTRCRTCVVLFSKLATVIYRPVIDSLAPINTWQMSWFYIYAYWRTVLWLSFQPHTGSGEIINF